MIVIDGKERVMSTTSLVATLRLGRCRTCRRNVNELLSGVSPPSIKSTTEAFSVLCVPSRMDLPGTHQGSRVGLVIMICPHPSPLLTDSVSEPIHG